ncbi:hypothetical protein N7524_006425 [Penicillium chrysogenum]|nr:hypothetical protein N7524_006425 [Penicillium chrysogenum]
MHPKTKQLHNARSEHPTSLQELEHGNASRGVFQAQETEKKVDKQDISVVEWLQIDELGAHSHSKAD